MPEMSDLIYWTKARWDKLNEHSGSGELEIRPYYFKEIGTGDTKKMVIISAKPSTTQWGTLHATDYLRLDRRAFEQLVACGAEVFGSD
jgi:hypothetical protein